MDWVLQWTDEPADFVRCLTIAILFIVFLTVVVLRTRCPNCRELNKRDLVSRGEVVDGTYLADYRCRHCGHEWTHQERESPDDDE